LPISPLCTPDISVKSSNGAHEANAVRCKRWSCEICAQINRRRVIALGVAGKPTAFLTLTVSSNHYETPDDAARDLKRGLVALRKRIRRTWPGETMSFLAVFEQHKSGWPHLHLLIRAPFMPIKWLKAAWEEITGSFMVNIQAIKNIGQRAFYVAKYVGKDLAAFTNCKRWWRSHDYNEPRAEDPEWAARCRGWTRHEGNIFNLAKWLHHAGVTVEVGRDGRLSWTDPPGSPIGVVAALRAADSWYGFGYRRSFSGARS
jgi:hypothetical protein